MSQKIKVLKALAEAGEKGLNSFWGYQNFIPRMGAIIFDLRNNGFKIKSVPQKDHSCQYIMEK